MTKRSSSGPLRVEWPVGPEFGDLDSRKGVYAWVKFKLDSADWYLGRLEQVLAVVPRALHQVGIEMALDGILESLCSAVDAACAAVINAAEARGHTKPPTPEFGYKPELAVKRLREHGRTRAPAALESARNGFKSSSPTGWFAQLGRLRNRAVHHTALTRTYFSGGPLNGEFHVEVPGLGLMDPLLYLRDVKLKTQRLTDQLLKEVSWLAPGQAIGQPSLSGVVQPQTAAVSVTASNATALT